MSEWLDAKGAAHHARVSASTILREARRGRLRAYKIAGGRLWRFTAADIDVWITKATIPEPFMAPRRGAA